MRRRGKSEELAEKGGELVGKGIKKSISIGQAFSKGVDKSMKKKKK